MESGLLSFLILLTVLLYIVIVVLPLLLVNRHLQVHIKPGGLDSADDYVFINNDLSSNLEHTKSTTAIYEGDENPERGNWSGKLDFLLSCLGYAVGLGNVWRFPYLCYNNGGGAFLVPYALMLFFIGIPVFFLELSVGQYSAMAPLTLFKNIIPFARGIGWTMFLCSCMVAIYYNNIIAWTIYYFFASFTNDLPWVGCGREHNTENCFDKTAFDDCTKYNGTIYNNGQCMNVTAANALGYYDHTNVTLRAQPPAEYLNNKVFGPNGGIWDLGGLQWHLVLCLLAAWVVVFFCLLKGIKSSGKVVYFTATFPYLVLIILVIRGCTLDGAYEGIRYYMVPDWNKVMDFKVWELAAIQIFFSLSTAGGGLITLASYNKFHTNVLRDTLIVCFGNCLTSVFAGFAIFSILGFMSVTMGQPIEEVAKSGGSGLAFIAYPDAVSRMPVSPLWAVLFFFMLFTLGLDSQFAIVENISTSLMDEFPALRPKKTLLMLAISIFGFILGLPITTKGGRLVLELMDYYSAGWPYLLVGLLELVLISWVYGIGNFFRDVHEMISWFLERVPCPWPLGQAIKYTLMVIYMVISPLIILVILFIAWIGFEPLSVGNYDYPMGANVIGWMMCIIPVMAIFISGVYQLFKYIYAEGMTPFEALRAGWKPTPKYRENAERVTGKTYGESTLNGFSSKRSDIIRWYPNYLGYDDNTGPVGKVYVTGVGHDNPGMEMTASHM